MAYSVMKSVNKKILVTRSLFDEPPPPYEAPEPIAPGAVLLRGFALYQAEALLQAARQVIAA